MDYLFSLLKFILSRDSIKSCRTYIGNKLLRFSWAKQLFDESIQKESVNFKEKNKLQFENFTIFKKMPEDGLDYDQCLELIKSYSDFVQKKTANFQFSGTIYQDTLRENPMDLHHLMKNLQSLYLEIFQRAHMWNGLHNDEFGIVNLINFQVISMVADLFGGKPEKIHGLVTTGGTQSIMTSARGYMNYGISERNLSRENCTIIAPDTIHCSLMKASLAYGFNLVLVPTDSDGQINDNDLKFQIEKYKSSLVALYCSYPSYPYGTKDDIGLFSRLASEYGIGFHVDCCLGGFIINFIDKDSTNLLSNKNITSLSVDTHKNGLCPKGSSVLITQELHKKNLFYYIIYAIPDWKGGLYGTPNDEGSSSCISAFCALITLLFYGKKFYKETAIEITLCANEMANEIDDDPRMEIINKNCINVVAMKSKLKTGSSYRFADIMHKKGYVFNALTDDTIHFCITRRFIMEENYLKKFMAAFKESMDKVEKEIHENPDMNYDGSARMYCSADSVKHLNDSTPKKYLENYFFGIQGISAVIKEHFMASNNPFYE